MEIQALHRKVAAAERALDLLLNNNNLDEEFKTIIREEYYYRQYGKEDYEKRLRNS